MIAPERRATGYGWRTGMTPLFVCLAFLLCSQPAEQQGRIASSEEVREAVRPTAVAPLRVLSWPYRQTTKGMEDGLIAVEKHKLREKLQDKMFWLRQKGITPKIGGSGEGSGFGGGVQYDVPLGEWQNLQFLGLITFKNYQEGGIQWSARIPKNDAFLESSYQWRPQENYYGQGHDTWRTWRTNFALRQSWAGARWEFSPIRRIRFGALHRWSWTRAEAGTNAALTQTAARFPGLPGYASERRLVSTGVYWDMDGLRDEYGLGGATHVGGSYNRSFDAGDLRYYSLEAQMEGRTPIKSQNSVLVGQANFEINREQGGSDRIPFYLQPHIGGSSTLRGYQLDRFYGRGLILATLEYRIRIHPNVQFYPFFDEGQIFEKTEDLRWLDWHRNYGFGFRFRSARGVFLTMEFGWGGEGTQFHLLFGTRERPPLRGPVRYGVYKR